MPRLARENTLQAFQLALQAGADGIELDVHVNVEADVVVHHNATVGSLGAAPITQLSTAELRGAGVPTLDEVCELVGDRATLYVEAKAARSAVAIVECLTAHDVRAAVHSFDATVIALVRTLAPMIPIGLLLDSNSNTQISELVVDHAIRDFWPNRKLIDASLVERAHAAGARVIAWTVNDAAEARRFRDLGVDGLCSDDVAALRSALQ
jgi:glycerophosphoryl diester phosphodiesterase